METTIKYEHDKLLTIEVWNESREIRQIRGKSNRYPTKQEMLIIRRWADQEGLEIASYLLN